MHMYIYVLSLKWHDQCVFSDTCSDHMQRHAERAISFAFWKICHFAVIFPSCKILQQNEKFSCQQNPTAKFDLFKAGKCENFKLICNNAKYDVLPTIFHTAKVLIKTCNCTLDF